MNTLNKHLNLDSHSLHIPATLSATMWAEFRSYCEGRVYVNSENFSQSLHIPGEKLEILPAKKIVSAKNIV